MCVAILLYVLLVESSATHGRRQRFEDVDPNDLSMLQKKSPGMDCRSKLPKQQALARRTADLSRTFVAGAGH